LSVGGSAQMGVARRAVQSALPIFQRSLGGRVGSGLVLSWKRFSAMRTMRASKGSL
jgi:hypothetical protein